MTRATPADSVDAARAVEDARAPRRPFSHRSVQTALGGMLVSLLPFGGTWLATGEFDRAAFSGALCASLTTLVVAAFRLNPR